MQPDYETYSYNQQPTGRYNFISGKMAAITICLLAVAFSGYLVVSAIAVRRVTGTIAVTTSDQQTEISVLQAGTAKTKIGTGNLTIRVKPGTYTVIAGSGDQQTAQTVTVGATTETTVDLPLNASIKQTTLAAYNAADAFMYKGLLAFLNVDTRTVYQYAPGDAAARPAPSAIYPSHLVASAANDRYIVRSGNVWYLVTDGSRITLPFGNGNPVDSGAVQVNSQGGYALVSNEGHLQATTDPAVAPQTISEVDSSLRASLATNGTILLYAPLTSGGHAAQFISQGKTKTIADENMNHIQTAEWSPNSAMLAFSTYDGLYTHTVASGNTRKVVDAIPTNPDTMTWLDNTTMLYAQDNAVWRYSTQTGASQKLGSFSGKIDGPHPFASNDNGSTIYYGTYAVDTASQKGALYRITTGAAASGSQTQNGSTSTSAPAGFSGFDQLTQQGLTSDQLANTQYAISQYLKSRSQSAKAITIPANGAQPAVKDPDNDFSTIVFTLRLDTTTLTAKLEYSGISTVQLLLYDAQNKQLYDSGTLQ